MIMKPITVSSQKPSEIKVATANAKTYISGSTTKSNTLM